MSERNVGRMVGLGCGLVGLAFVVMCGLSTVVGGLFSIFDGGGLARGPSARSHEEQTPEWLEAERAESGGVATGPLLPPPPPRPLDMRTHRMTLVVEEATGASAPAQVGDTCTLTLSPRERSGGAPWCHVDVRCGEGPVLFGGPDQGFFNCTFGEGSPPHVAGGDAETTQGDQDAAFSLDTVASTFELRDDVSGSVGEYALRGSVRDRAFE